jgi:hypothetical protein
VFGLPDARYKNGVPERMIHSITEKARAIILDFQALLEFGGKQTTLQYISTNAYQIKNSPKETIATDIKIPTGHHP